MQSGRTICKLRDRVISENEPVMVSICVVTYNHARFIADCLDHILDQETDFRCEILIHDDASTDGAQDIIRRYQERYPALVLPILRTENQYSRGITNITGAFNFPRARGRYVATTDGDDYWCDPGKLRTQVDYMEAHPETGFCFHSAQVVNEDGAFVNAALMRPYRSSRIVSPEDLIDRTVGIPFGSFLLRRSLVEMLPDYYTECPVGDRPLELIAAAHGGSYYMDTPMSVYRFSIRGSWTEEMRTGDYAAKQRRFADRMDRTYEDFDRETDGRFHDAAMRAARRNRFLTSVNLRDFREIYRPENRGFLRELSFRDRFFIRLEHTAPGLYRGLQRLYGSFRRS